MARILVVDDIAENRDLVVTLLRYAGHELAEASNGEQALAQVRAWKPDLVVCDVLMPQMDGYEFVRHLRDDPAIAHTEIVFYTATFLEQEALVLARACGVRHVLTKPCEPEVIIATVNSALADVPRHVPGTHATPEFDRDHLRLVTDKLVQKTVELEQANGRLEALIDLGVQLASERGTTALLDKFCGSVRSLFGARLALLSVRDKPGSQDRQLVVSGDDEGLAEAIRRLQFDPGLAPDHVRASRFDAVGGSDTLRRTLARYMPDARSALLAPLVSLNKRYGWILLVDKPGSDSFSEYDQRALAVQAAQAGRIYENGSLYARVQEQVAMLLAQAQARERDAGLLRLEHNVARALAAADTIENGLATVIQAVCESQRWDVGRLWKMHEEAGVLRLAMEWFAPAVPKTVLSLPGATVRPPGEGLIGRVWRTREPLWIPDLRKDSRVLPGAIAQLPGLVSASIFPLISGGRTFGVLAFLGRETRQPDQRMEASVRTIGDQLGQFIQRAQAEEAVKASEHFIRSTMDSLLEHVCVIDSNGVVLTVNRAWREFAHTEGDQPVRVLEGANYLQACASAFGAGAVDARVMAAGIRNVIRAHQPTFTMEYACDSPTEARWFLARATRFAGDGPVRVVVAHENITERKHAEQRIRRLHRVSSMLSDINALIVRVKSRDELFRDACRIVIDTGRFKKAWIGLLHHDPIRVEVVASGHDGSGAEYFQHLHAELAKHVGLINPQFDHLIVRQQPLLSNDIANNPWMALRDVSLTAGARSAAAVPLVLAAQTRGMLMLYSDEVDYFDEDEVKLLQELAGDLSFAMDHLGQAEQLNHLAYYDALTGHANSMLFNERVAQFVDGAAANNTRLAIGVLDIERFKSINDVWGRHTGDELLRQLSTRMLGALGDRSRLARVGPDQFGLVMQNAPQGIELSRALADFYNACFAAVFACGNATIHAGGRLGVALYPDDGADAETLFRNAEAAVKRAKQSTEHVLLYDAQASAAIADKIALEMRLRDALAQDRFVLHYQPKVDAQSRSIVAVEALIRWQDPDLGLVPPFRFIPLMEETGLIVEVGGWALRQAARDRRSWLDRGLTAPPIAVNVSAVQLHRADFVDTVLAALGTPAALAGIDLEITESAAMEDVDNTIAKLLLLREHGIALAIDDFGTGYSSLAYLSKLPVQVLKIDRAFTMRMTEDPNTMTLVATMISLAHAMRMEVVAEGVETEEQAEALQRLMCDQLQGYLISRPVPEPAMALMLQPALAA